MNLLDLYKDLAKRFKLKLTVGPGVSQYEGDATVRPLTFVLSANNDGGLTIRLMQAGGARRDPAPLLDGTWGWSREDPQTGQELYNVTSEARRPMAFEEEGWDKPEQRYTWEQVKAMERSEFDHRLDLHSIYGELDWHARTRFCCHGPA